MKYSFYLACAILLEVAGTKSMKLSKGFTNINKRRFRGNNRADTAKWQSDMEEVNDDIIEAGDSF